MTDIALFFIVAAISGVFTLRWLMRLAPLMTEVPLKTMIAVGLSGLMVVYISQNNVSTTLLVIAFIAVFAYVFMPLILVALARARQFGLAGSLTQLLYWSADGRLSIKRLLSQVALQQGDAVQALALMGEDADTLLLIQAYSLEERWQDVLALPAPETGDNSFLAAAARARALLELGRVFEAEGELSRMQARWELEEQGPLGYRAITLTKARMLAYQGAYSQTHEVLKIPLPNVAPYVVLEILGIAAERAKEDKEAIKYYAQAYAVAPERQQQRFASKLEGYKVPLPKVQGRGQRRSATLIFVAVLALAYGVQLWIERRIDPNLGVATAAFILNVPSVPESDAFWRFLSYGFLHGGIVHLGFNLWVLFDIGSLYERRRSWGSLLAAFVLGTIMGAYFTLLAQGNDQLILVGASGGILGIAGALLADTWRGRNQQDRHMTRSLLQWMAIIVVFSLAIPNVSLWGHLGGIVGGLLWGFLRQGLPKDRRVDLLVGGISIGLMASAILYAAQWFMTYS